MVFAPDLLQRDVPLSQRVEGIVLGSIIMVLAVAVLISPRMVPILAPIVTLACMYYGLKGARRIFDTPSKFIILSLAFAVLSSVWSPWPKATLFIVLTASAYVVAIVLSAYHMSLAPRKDIVHMAEGLWIGLIVGLMYLLVELLSDQAIKLHVYNFLSLRPGDLKPPDLFRWSDSKLIAIHPADLTRNAAPVLPFLFPALLAIQGTTSKSNAKYFSGLLVVLAALVVFLSEHETSKVGLLASVLLFVIAKWRSGYGRHILSLGWLIACLGVIPCVLFLHALDVQHAQWLQNTGKQRVEIWKYVADEALQAPVFGHGANAMYYRTSTLNFGKKRNADIRQQPHPHNAYLGIWFEFGATGAILIFLSGLALLQQIGKLESWAQPFVQATFTSCAVLASASYGLWQTWFVSLFALSAAFVGIALQANRTRPPI